MDRYCDEGVYWEEERETRMGTKEEGWEARVREREHLLTDKTFVEVKIPHKQNELVFLQFNFSHLNKYLQNRIKLLFSIGRQNKIGYRLICI